MKNTKEDSVFTPPPPQQLCIALFYWLVFFIFFSSFSLPLSPTSPSFVPRSIRRVFASGARDFIWVSSGPAFFFYVSSFIPFFFFSTQKSPTHFSGTDSSLVIATNMENRVVALAVLENLIHWPLPHRSGYVAPSSSGGGVADEGGEDDSYASGTVSAGDADDLLREPRQRRLDRYRAVLLLPHLCHKLGSRWVESEVVPYLLRCVEEEDPQLSLVSGLALLGVALPRRTPLGPPSAVSTTAAAPPSSDAAPAKMAAGATPPTPLSASNTASSTTTAATTTSQSSASANAYLSLDDVQPVCALLAASGTEETRAFTAQVVLPHLYFGTGLERDVTLESWDLKFVPLSVLHADMIASNSGSGGGAAEDDDGSPAAAAAAARAEEGNESGAALSFIAAVRKQLILCQRAQALLKRDSKNSSTAAAAGGGGESDTSPSYDSVAINAKDAAADLRLRSSVLTPTDEDVRIRCQALAAEDEAMQFLFSGTYDMLTGPWGFSGCRLASLTQGAKTLFASSDSRCDGRQNGSSSEKRGTATTTTAISTGGGFRSFRSHQRRVSGSQALRGAPPPSQRPLSEADLELYGASYAVDKVGNTGTSGCCCDAASAGCDDFFSVNVRARALVGDLVRWMEALTPAAEALTSPSESLTNPTSPSSLSSSAPSSPSAPPQPRARSALFLPGQTLTLYDYFSHGARREVLRSRWRGQLKLLQSLLESPYPGPVAVAVELISGLLHALQFVMREVEDFLLCSTSEDGNAPLPADSAASSEKEKDDDSNNDAAAAELLWGIAVPSTPLLTTAQLQSFLYRATRRHIAYCIVAAVSTRRVDAPAAPSAATAHNFRAKAAIAAWRAPSKSLARLLRDAIPAAQRNLMDLLFHHHLLLKLNLAPSADQRTGNAVSNSKNGNNTGEWVLLQMGAGPCESRAAALSAWDVSFIPSSMQVGACVMPDDASFLLNASTGTTAEAATGSTSRAVTALDRALWLPGTLNAFSVFRVHRVIRRALLRALPLAVDFLSLANPSSSYSSTATTTTTTVAASAASGASATTTTTATGPPSSALFAVYAVCPMLLQVLVPPGTLPALLRVLHAAATLPDDAVNASEASKSTHVDPSLTSTSTPTLESAFPALWAAMTAPGSIMGATETSTSAVQGQETPSSLDFELLEAALDAVQRLTAEAAVQLSTILLSSSLRTVASAASKKAPSAACCLSSWQLLALHSLCAQLFTLVAACVRWVPQYISWKARWLIADKLPRLVSTFCFLLAAVAELKVTNAAAVSVMWLQCTLQLLTSVWSCAAAFGVAPLNDLTDDEEMEVRCMAVRCAAGIFRRVVEAALRVSVAVSTAASASRTSNNVASSPSSSSTPGPAVASSALVLLLPMLTDPLTQLLDATAQCVLVGANDVEPRVRCRAAEALAVLSRALSMLVAADARSRQSSNALKTPSNTNNNNDRGSKEAVWTRYLRSNTDALLRLMGDEKPIVQLALVSQLTDLLLMRMRQPGQLNKAKGSLMGSRDNVDAPVGDSSEDEDQQQRSADQVQQEALLRCLRQLAQHELWRLREQYAVLLAHLCGRLLQTAMIPPRKVVVGGRLTSGPVGAKANGAESLKNNSNSGSNDNGSMAAAGASSEAANTSMLADVSPYGHTHPLYQLARTELLTLLVAVLFDKVKAVRDAALDAVEQMCLQLAAATRQANNSLQQDAASCAGLAGSGADGPAGTGRTFESIISSSSALQNASKSDGNGYNINTFIDNVLWPRIAAYDKAWETYLSRSALLHIALRLRVDKTSVFIPLLDQLARDPVLNVRLVVAKVILEVLLRSSPDLYATPLTQSRDGEDEGGAGDKEVTATSYKPDLPSGTVAYRILMNKPAMPLTSGGSGDGFTSGNSGVDAVLPPLQFTEEERTGVILEILRQLLKDASSDVRDEAAKALKVCF